MSTGETELVGRALNSQRMFSWGANSYGQHGSGNSDDTPVPKELQLSEVWAENIVSMNGGGGHTHVLLENGTLLVCGSNEKGQLGIGSTENISVLTPVKDLEGEIIIKVDGGWDFTLILNDKGQIFVTGSNHFNQLGIPDLEEKFITRPTKLSLPGNPFIVDISTGLRHGVALTDKGEIYQWGRRKASKSKDTVVTPNTVKIPPLLKGRVLQITAGSYFFVGLTDCGEIICWGENNYGQLSLSPDITKVIVDPYIVNMQHFEGRVIDVQTGWTHVLALTDKRIIYSWGRANYGQLGRKVDLQFDPTPQPIRELYDVMCIRCGSEHNLALTGVDKKLMTWGWNEHGLCGNGSEDNVPIPHQVEALSKHVIKLIGCGAGHSFALTEKT